MVRVLRIATVRRRVVHLQAEWRVEAAHDRSDQAASRVPLLQPQPRPPAAQTPSEARCAVSQTIKIVLFFQSLNGHGEFGQLRDERQVTRSSRRRDSRGHAQRRLFAQHS